MRGAAFRATPRFSSRARTSDPSYSRPAESFSDVQLERSGNALGSFSVGRDENSRAVQYHVPTPEELAQQYPRPPRSTSQELAQRYPPPPRASQGAGGERRHRPIFCIGALVINSGAFVYEIYSNNWALQPFACPATCLGGSPCFEDGAPCEANPLLGPTVAVLDALGAKNDMAIFERGEWWRIIVCNWLHVGIVHAALNMIAIWSVGGELERAFGFWRVGFLYIFAGVFGTLVSIVFLPGVLSVGASASVFGLVGANWADVIVNFCARCTLKGSGILCLSVATVLNVAVGFTPYVDNFMHLGGLVAGLVVGLSVFAQKTVRDPRTGRRVRTCGQELVSLVAVVVLLVLSGGAIGALLSTDLQVCSRPPLRAPPRARQLADAPPGGTEASPCPTCAARRPSLRRRSCARAPSASMSTASPSPTGGTAARR